MTRFMPVLLDVWREACKHIEIGESVSRIGPVLTRRVPVDLVLVRRLDPQRSAVETVAAGVCGTGAIPEQTRNECTPEQFSRLLGWCREGRDPSRRRRPRYDRAHPALLPAGVDGAGAGRLAQPRG